MSKSLSKIKTRRKPSSIKKLLKIKKKRARFIFLFSGVFLIILSIFLSSGNSSNQQEDRSVELEQDIVTFANEPVKIDDDLLRQKSAEVEKKPPVRIIIPEVGIDLPIKSSRVINGYWEVFTYKAGWGIGSAFPSDESGNQVIFAHARRGLFLPLKNSEVNQKIYIMSEDKWYEYKIVEIKEVLPSQIEVISSTKDKTLTLYTCTGFDDSKRLIVIAKPINN